MTISRKYRRSADPAIISYSYVDVASGIGNQKFYLADFSSGANYVLTPSNTISSDNAVTIGRAANATPTKLIDQVYQTEFNLPRLINGDVLFNISAALSGANGGGRQELKVAVDLKLSGAQTIKTLVSELSGANYIIAESNQLKDKVFSMSAPVKKQLIQAGDVLKLGVRVWGSNELNSSAEFDLYHSPDGLGSTRSDTTTPRTVASSITLPFKIDV